jgi:hypothetical protein
MMPLSLGTATVSVPDVLSGVAQGGRYRYFAGKSGKRYIFTRMRAADLEDCRQAVVILLPRKKPEQSGSAGGPVWIGEIDGYGKRRGPRLSKSRLASSEVFVHLLAENAGSRRAILIDLADASDKA